MISQRILGKLRAYFTNNSLYKHYVKLLAKYSLNPPTSHYEVHHIIPRSWDRSLIDDQDNLVKVSIDQYVRLHQLLSYTNDRSMIFAFWHTLTKRPNSLSANQHAIALIASKQQMLNVNGRAVINLNTLETFPSIAKAAASVGVSASTCRISIIGKTRAGGYYFEFIDCVNDPAECLIEREHIAKERSAAKNANRERRKVLCLDTGIVYQSIDEAADAVGVKYSSIVQAIRKHTKSARTYWGYVDEISDRMITLRAYQDETQLHSQQKRATHSLRMKANNSNSKRIRNTETGEIVSCARELDKRLGLKVNTTLRRIHSKRPINDQLWEFI